MGEERASAGEKGLAGGRGQAIETSLAIDADGDLGRIASRGQRIPRVNLREPASGGRSLFLSGAVTLGIYRYRLVRLEGCCVKLEGSLPHLWGLGGEIEIS